VTFFIALITTRPVSAAPDMAKVDHPHDPGIILLHEANQVGAPKNHLAHGPVKPVSHILINRMP